MAAQAEDKRTQQIDAKQTNETHGWLTPEGQQTVKRALNLRASQLKRQINTEENQAIKQILQTEYQQVLQYQALV